MAENYRTELTPRTGLEFDLHTGDPALPTTPARPATTWYQPAVAMR